MGRCNGWKRLLWKEFREGWLVAVVLFVVPVVLACFTGSPYGEVLVVLATMGMVVVVVAWAAVKAGGENTAREFAPTHLPLRGVREWIPAFLAPCVITTLAGVWLGVWYAKASGRPAIWESAALWASALAGLFALGYLLSRTFSLWLSIAVGVVLGIVLSGVIPATLDQINNPSMRQWQAEQYAHFRPFARALALSAAAPALGSLALALLPRRLPRRTTKAVALGLAVAIIAAANLGSVIGAISRSRHTTEWQTIWEPYTSVDGSVRVVLAGPAGPSGKPGAGSRESRIRLLWSRVLLRCNDFRSGVSLSREFRSNVTVIGVGGGGVILAQQLPGEGSIRILRWDVRANTVRQAALAPAGKNALLRGRYFFPSSVSPDGRYAFVGVRSLTGSGGDLWLVNLRSGRSVVAYPGRDGYQFNTQEVDWRGDRAVLSGQGEGMYVDLKHGRGVPIKIGAIGGEQQ